MDRLLLDTSKYEVKTCEIAGRTIRYRAFEDLIYCEAPKDPIQKLNLYAPEAYYEGGTINGYTLKTAPIFMPNTVGGYMQGPAMQPGTDFFTGGPNTAFEALSHGYVVACAGVRGRNTGEKSREFFVGGGAAIKENEQGLRVGRAPAFIVDMKAAIRYLRHNAETIPGDPEKIITNGTSAGGALSALTGASGNCPAYEPYLEAIGAAKERDDIFAASCYCPIHNLEHADIAYEWLFHDEQTYHRMNFVRTEKGVEQVPVIGRLTEKQIQVSKELKDAFPAYVNSLGLQDAQGNALCLNADGTGSFAEQVRRWVVASAQRELETHSSAGKGRLMVPGSEVEKQAYLSIEGGRVNAIDWKGYVKAITRMKAVPAFDALDLNSPECEEFGDENVYARHFTETAERRSEVDAEMADPAIVHLMNPVDHIGTADTAPHWRIRHGAYDRDTSLAIPVILGTLLQNRGYDVDFFLPWGLPHSGDYDLDELFAWIDKLCQG